MRWREPPAPREGVSDVRGVANLVIAGVTKAGTTSLFHYLGQHPEVCPSKVKETNYFSVLHGPGAWLGPASEYEAHFAQCRGETYRLDATPNYFYGGERLIAEVKRICGAPKVIISLRDPAERMWSTYLYAKSKFRLDPQMNFAEYVESCRRLSLEGTDFDPDHRPYRSYSTGFYTGYLRQWISAFGPDLRIVFFEHLAADPEAVVVGLCDWLNLESDPVAGFDFGARNRTIQTRSRRLRRFALSLNKAAAPVVERRPRVKAALRTAYERVNASPQTEEFSSELKRGLSEDFKDENAALRRLLLEEGYEHFPSWLEEA
jgi:hypothetical protein